jgi:DNA (cytosine-5)-methyltransferase 1
MLRSHGLWDAREVVSFIVQGVEVVIADIGMRMLTPRELFNAQGFPPDYQIETAPDGTVFSKSCQIGRAGNSVCPPFAAAHVRANCGHLIEAKEAAA